MKKSPEKQEAKDAGFPRYYTGDPCRSGHVCDRYVKDGACVECTGIKRERWRNENRERARELTREWRAENPEKLRISQKKSHAKQYQKNRPKRDKKSKEHRLRNPEKYKMYWAKYAKDNVQKIRERAKRRRERDPERVREQVKAAKQRFNERHPLDGRIRAHNRRAKLRQNGGVHSETDIEALNKFQRGKCAYCRVSLKVKYHIDHIIAVANGGSNDRRNLQLLCPPCNQQKWRHDPIEFSRQRGMLL